MSSRRVREKLRERRIEFDRIVAENRNKEPEKEPEETPKEESEVKKPAKKRGRPKKKGDE